MRKEDAISLFNGVSATARKVRITRAAVSKWPDVLSDAIADRVIAAAVRHNIKIPEHMLRREEAQS